MSLYIIILIEDTHIEFVHYWFIDNIIFVKPHFNDNIQFLNLDDEIVSLKFTNHDQLENIKESIKGNKYKAYNYLPYSKFNQPVDNLPPNILNLTFGNSFNKNVDNLPHSIINLTFGHEFNKSVDNLPPLMQNLTFGWNFNCTIDNLPSSLLNLTFGYEFNQLIDNLPNSIISINFCEIILFFHQSKKIFDKQLNCLPNSIYEIKLPHNYDQEIIKIPLNLKKISCSSSYNYIDKLKINNIKIEIIN